MANIINIGAKLEAAKPVLQLGEDEIYIINDDKNAVIKANALTTAETKEGENEFDRIYEALALLLGKEQLKKIEQLHPGATKSVNQLLVLFFGTMAGVSGTSYEDMESTFRNAKGK